MRDHCLFAALAAALVCLGDTARANETPGARLGLPDTQLEPLEWTAIEGWRGDDHAAALAAFQVSCKPLVYRLKWRNSKKPHDARAMYAALTDICVHAMKVDSADSVAAREFFEHHFRPVQIATLGEQTGLLTGYYEPIIEGSRFPSNHYTVPVYATPSNLILAGRRKTKEAGFPNKGRVGRRLGRKKIVPYYDRGEIMDGVLAGRGLEICWVKDPIDAFFMQIQGSARVKLDTGKMLRLNYAAHNGHPYTPVGRILISRGEVSKEEMSMDRIRTWMEQSPDGGKELRRENRSYVFMRETGLADDAEPTGAQGISLTPGRSIAVDRKLHVYGTLFFISAELPIESERPITPFRRLMVAQDTGSAIVGPARADIYFGAGEELGRIAGRIKQQGRFVMLVPRALDPARGAGDMPLPLPRPPEAGPPFIMAAVAPVPTPARATAKNASPPQTARLVPVPQPRPQIQEPPRLAEPALPPGWLPSVKPPQSAEDTLRSVASGESAIISAASAPLAFAAPERSQATASILRQSARIGPVPLPRARPQGSAPVRQ